MQYGCKFYFDGDTANLHTKYGQILCANLVGSRWLGHIYNRITDPDSRDLMQADETTQQLSAVGVSHSQTYDMLVCYIHTLVQCLQWVQSETVAAWHCKSQWLVHAAAGLLWKLCQVQKTHDLLHHTFYTNPTTLPPRNVIGFANTVPIGTTI